MRQGVAAAIAVGILLAAASSAAGARTASTGILTFSGGIRAHTKIDRSSCTAGPGNGIRITLANVGGWASLFLTASAPAQGKKGTAKVSLQGTGASGNDYAIAVWSWSKPASSGTAKQVQIANKGTQGTLKLKLPLAGVDDGPTLPDVAVALKWAPGTCA